MNKFYNRIKKATKSTEDDSILGATVRRIMQEELALEAMQAYDADPIFNTETFEEMEARVQNEDSK
jgi:hypothetical protein